MKNIDKCSESDGAQEFIINNNKDDCIVPLLDDNLPVKSFPTTYLEQFWILLKRITLSASRDQALTRLRLVAHLINGILMGFLFYDIGNDASKVNSISGCLFFITLFVMFFSLMPTILTCK